MFNLSFYHIFVTLIMTLQIIAAITFAMLGLSGPVGLIIGGALYFALPVFIFIKVSAQKTAKTLSFKRLSTSNMLYTVALSVSVYPLALILSAITSIFFTNHIPEVVGGMAAQVNPLIMFAAFALSPAFFEEILLRGMLAKPLMHLGFKGALLNGLYFGLIHLNPHQFFYAFALGVLLYYMLILTGSIWAPILSHFIINSLALILFFWLPLLQEGQDMAVWFFIVSPIAFVFLLKNFIQKNRHRLEEKEDLPPPEGPMITPSFVLMISVYIFIVFSFSLF